MIVLGIIFVEPIAAIPETVVSGILTKNAELYKESESPLSTLGLDIDQMQYEVYRKDAVFIRLTDDFDLIAKYVEVLNIKNRKLILDKRNVFYSVPLCLNQFFVPEVSPVLECNEKVLAKKLFSKNRMK